MWRLTVSVGVLVVAVVVALGFVDPPATAFMMQARLAAWREGRTLSIEHVWMNGACVANALRLAVIAAEDQKFPGHWGFDVAEIVDALEQAGRGARLRGASTLSQQTAKNLFLWPGQSWVRKGLEATLTALVEASWSKQRILEVYLNVAEFGPGVYGAEAAARRYFGKSAAELSATESALLAAVLPNPKVLRVAEPSAYVRQRQHRILSQMRQIAGLPAVDSLLQEATAVRCTRTG